MSVIKVQDVEYVRFAAPDLGLMRTFLLDFGLIDSVVQSEDRLLMRASGDSPVVHVTELGPPGFRGLALRADSIADLELLAQHEGVPLEDSTLPGGGKVVRLVDPNGFGVDVVAGQERATARPTGMNAPWNSAVEKARGGVAKRVPGGPSKVLRLGHVVMIVNDLRKTWEWWRDRFGVLMSDEVLGPDGVSAAMFIRCDRGKELADHHSLNIATVPGKSAQFHHAAFEVADLDDLMAGHEHLKARGYVHSWGIGRHILGSQVFDYWCDPFGHRIEHWTDGDLFDASSPANITDIGTMLGHQWGPAAPADFV